MSFLHLPRMFNLGGGLSKTLFALAVMSPGAAFAQVAGGNPLGSMTNAICSMIKPLVGSSPLVSLVFLIALGVMIFLWWMNENKEGVMVWVLRTGIAIGIIINLITIPTLIGLPSPCA